METFSISMLDFPRKRNLPPPRRRPKLKDQPEGRSLQNRNVVRSDRPQPNTGKTERAGPGHAARGRVWVGEKYLTNPDAISRIGNQYGAGLTECLIV